jgi:hypothetical protein
LTAESRKSTNQSQEGFPEAIRGAGPAAVNSNFTTADIRSGIAIAPSSKLPPSALEVRLATDAKSTLETTDTELSRFDQDRYDVRPSAGPSHQRLIRRDELDASSRF